VQVVIIIAVLFKFKYDVQNVQNVLRMYEKTNVLFFSFRDFQFLYLVLLNTIDSTSPVQQIVRESSVTLPGQVVPTRLEYQCY
jgi:hypothetical protein